MRGKRGGGQKRVGIGGCKFFLKNGKHSDLLRGRRLSADKVGGRLGGGRDGERGEGRSIA